MAARDRHHLLGRLSDTDDTILAGEQDLHGRQVVDSEGNGLGTVDDLVVDLHDHTVRLLQVRQGGVLGLGSSTIFVPVEAISRTDQDRVWINLAGQDEQTPVYDPAVVRSDHRSDRFGENGNPPFPLPGGLGPPYTAPGAATTPGEDPDRSER